MLYPGLIRTYRKYLPVAEESIVTLHEGRTPLFESKRINGMHKRIQGANLGVTDTYINLHEWWIPDSMRKY